MLTSVSMGQHDPITIMTVRQAIPWRAHVRKVLIANRGEIAVRVARACRDAGLGSLAVYAEPTWTPAPAHGATRPTRWAGRPARRPTWTSTRSSSGGGIRRDAVHPGYGFLAENAEFARAVAAAGLTWIGPPPEAIEALGDKVRARHIALEAGAPLTPGTPDPVRDAGEVLAFAGSTATRWRSRRVRAAGAGSKWPARGRGRLPVRVGGPGGHGGVRPGECFVERYLDRPRTWRRSA